MNDGFSPSISHDHSHGTFGTWPHLDPQWIQYEWTKPITTGHIALYWWDDGSPMLAVPNYARMNRVSQDRPEIGTGEDDVNYAPGTTAIAGAGKSAPANTQSTFLGSAVPGTASAPRSDRSPRRIDSKVWMRA